MLKLFWDVLTIIIGIVLMKCVRLDNPFSSFLVLIAGVIMIVAGVCAAYAHIGY